MRNTLSTILASALLASGASAATITYQAYTTTGFAAETGTLLPAGNLVRVGYFDVSLATVESNALDFNYLKTHFVQLDTTAVGSPAVGSEAGYFNDSFNVDTKASVNPGLGGRLLYIWAYQSTDNSSTSQSINTATRHALLTLNSSLWQLPTDPEVGSPGSLFIDIVDITNGSETGLVAQGKLIAGGYPVTTPANSGPTTKQIGLVSTVPEPTSAALLMLGLVSLAARRRREAK